MLQTVKVNNCVTRVNSIKPSLCSTKIFVTFNHSLTLLLKSYQYIFTIFEYLIIDYSDLKETARKLTEWVQYESWTYCKDCHLLHPRKMLPTYATGKMEYAKLRMFQREISCTYG